MRTWDRLVENIGDIKEYLIDDSIKILPLLYNEKHPGEKDYYNKEYSLNQITKNRGNLGICVGYNHESNGKSIGVIDIDGYTDTTVTDEEQEKIKKQTANDIYNVLKDMPGCMIVQSQSGGHHIYYWNETPVDNIHKISESLCFPDDYHIEHLRGKSLDQSIEIFTKWKSKQCVLPGSTIKNRATKEIREYKVVSQIDTLQDIDTVSNIHEKVKEAMTNAGYKYDPSQHKKEKNEYNDDDPQTITHELKKLTPNEVKKVTDILTPYIEKMDGLYHDFYLYLGGYLCNRVSKDSAKKIAENLQDARNSDYNKHITTTLKNYDREGHKKGLNSLLHLIQRRHGLTDNQSDRLRFDLEKVCKQGYRHHILLNQESKNKKKYLVIDYDKCEIGTYTQNKTKDGKVFYTNNHIILNLNPLRFYEAYNILDNQATPEFCLKYYRESMPFPQIIRGNSIENIERQLKQRPGIVLKPREAPGILNEIIREYIKLGLVETVTEVPVPGIFINPLTGELVRAGTDGELPITKPSKDAVKDALLVWKNLKKVYAPSKSNRSSRKLSHIIRHGLIVPFSYILKTMYEWYPMLVLYGASRTAKTTLAEISLSVWIQIDDEISVGGSSVDTPYRMGNAISRHGIGIIVNEPSDILERNGELLELLKRATESGTCREKMDNGVHTKIPAYSNLIVTSNNFVPIADAFVRRCQRIDFHPSERLDENDKKLFKNTFHHVNWKDTDFLKLQSIGDFICWYVSQHLEVLSKPHDEIVDSFLDELIKFTGVNKEDYTWLYETADLVEDINSSDDYIVEQFRLMVLSDYKSNYNRIKPKDLDNILQNIPVTQKKKLNFEDETGILEDCQIVFEDNNSTDESHEVLFKAIFLWMVERDWIPYLVKDTKDNIGIRTSVSDALHKRGIVETATGLADKLGVSVKSTTHKGKKMRLAKLSYDSFREVLL